MYKIAICGKANTGKNTVSKLIVDEPRLKLDSYKLIAFADPIKEIAKLMFPEIKRKWLYGSSKYRAQAIPNAFKDGNPLTIRQLLIDLGTGVGRAYRETTWLDAFDYTFEKSKKNNIDIVIVTDVRFRNEFDHLKKMGFFQIRLLRDAHLKINHSSETNQDSIHDQEFDYVLSNNGTLDDLKLEVTKIVTKLVS
jgi:hypothetical protein